MSSAALDIPAFLYAQQGDAPAPLEYVVTTAGAIQPTASTATFDGTGAGGQFLACLSFYAQSGELLSRVFPQTIIQAGDVAQVSYAPFPGGMTTNATPAGGIQYDVDNVGDWLNIKTTTNEPATIDGQTFQAVSGLIKFISSDPTLNGESGLETSVFDDFNQGITQTIYGLLNGGWKVTVNGTQGVITLLQNGDGGIQIDNEGVGDTVVKGGGIAQFQGGGLTQLQSTGGQVNILALNSGITALADFPIILDALGGTTEAVIQMRITTHGNYFSILDNTPVEQLRVTPQATIMFALSDKTGARIFEVHDDGSLHGKTGQALTFDL